MLTGGCHCGAVRYEAHGEPLHHALCHCSDCRSSAGAPAVSWIAFKSEQVRLTQGELKVFQGKQSARRHFCADCGSGLLYTNAEMLPGITDIQSATLDDAGSHAPQVQIQCAERLAWFEGLAALPEFERFPSQN